MERAWSWTWLCNFSSSVHLKHIGNQRNFFLRVRRQIGHDCLSFLHPHTQFQTQKLSQDGHKIFIFQYQNFPSTPHSLAQNTLSLIAWALLQSHLRHHTNLPPSHPATIQTLQILHQIHLRLFLLMTYFHRVPLPSILPLFPRNSLRLCLPITALRAPFDASNLGSIPCYTSIASLHLTILKCHCLFIVYHV